MRGGTGIARLTPLVAAILAAGFGLAAARREEPPGQKPLFPGGTEIVTVDAVVVDRQGEPVTGLAASDFAVREDGVLQEVAAFEAVQRPTSAAPATTPAALAPPSRTASNTDPAAREIRAFVIAFDERHLEPAEATWARRAVSAFLQTGVGAGDRVTLVGTFEGASWTARMPDGREALLQVLGRLQGRRVIEMAKDTMSDYEAMRIDRDRDPIVTDRVARRFVETGAVFNIGRLPGDPPDRGENLDTQRDQVRARAAEVYLKATADNETTLGLVERSLQGLAGVRGRKSLILVSGGLVQDPHLAGFRRVVTESRRANVAVYFLDARGLTAGSAALRADTGLHRPDFNDLGSTLEEAHERSEGSEGLAADTGGFSVRNTNDLESGFHRISRESSSYYLLGYSPSNKKADGAFRKIEVKVARPGATVRARRGYYAPGGKTAEAPNEGRDAAIQAALNAPFDLPDVPLRAITHVFGESELGKVDVLVTMEADIRSLAFTERGGTAKDTLELLLLVADRASGQFHRFDQQFVLSLGAETRARYARTGFPIARQFPLAPGEYQARIVARDANSGRLGSLAFDFTVPAPGGFRLSTPVLSDRLRDDPKGPRLPEPTARRTFAPAGVLHCHFELYGAARDPGTGQSRATAGFSIRRSDGRFLAAVAETALRPGPDGSLSRSFGASLDGAPPGRYEMILVATDLVAGKVAESREPFVIEAPSAP